MKRRATCRQCGGHWDDVGRISARGLCNECGVANSQMFAEQMKAKSGPVYNYWLRKQIAGTAAYQAELQAQLDAQARRLG